MESNMEKRAEFIEKILHLIRKKLEANLPKAKEGTLEDLMKDSEKIIDKIFK